MKRLLKISSITGSAFEPMASRLGRGSARRSRTWFLGVIEARQPSSTTIVWLASMTSAGPSRPAPIGSDSRKTTFAFRHAPLEKICVSRKGVTAAPFRIGRVRSAKRAAPPAASADTASMTSALARSMKPKRCLWARSKARRIAEGTRRRVPGRALRHCLRTAGLRRLRIQSPVGRVADVGFGRHTGRDRRSAGRSRTPGSSSCWLRRCPSSWVCCSCSPEF